MLFPSKGRKIINDFWFPNIGVMTIPQHHGMLPSWNSHNFTIAKMAAPKSCESWEIQNGESKTCMILWDPRWQHLGEQAVGPPGIPCGAPVSWPQHQRKKLSNWGIDNTQPKELCLYPLSGRIGEPVPCQLLPREFYSWEIWQPLPKEVVIHPLGSTTLTLYTILTEMSGTQSKCYFLSIREAVATNFNK